jgi:cobalt-zinc-cadmium efflux system outer membrane protein
MGFKLRLTLNDAFRLADQNNLELQAAQKNLPLAAAGITSAGALPNPNFELSYGFGQPYYQSVSGGTQQFGLNQTLLLGGKRKARVNLANAQYRLTNAQLKTQRFTIRSQVRQAYAELVAARAYADIIEESSALVAKLANIARKRFEAGAAPELESMQASLALSQFDTQRNQARGRIQQAEVKLNVLLGATPGRGLEVPDKGLFKLHAEKTELVPASEERLPSLDDLVVCAYHERLDLRAAVRQVDVSRWQLTLAKLQRVPDMTLGTGYVYTNYTEGTPQQRGAYVNAQFPLPILYRQQGEIAQAKIQVAQSHLQARALRLQIAGNVEAAYRAVIVARQNILKYQNELLPESAKVVVLAQRRYLVGKSDLASAILAQQSDQQLRAGFLDAVVSYQTAWADLETAIGGPIQF